MEARMHKIDSQLTRDKVVAELRRDILYGNIKANQELYQDKIAEELGVSRMPVREALQVLHNDGPITVKPNKIAKVNEISDKFIHDHFEIRTLLEQEAVKLVCQKNLDLKPLWDSYYAAEKAIKSNNFKQFNDFNREIHYFIWHAADNLPLEHILSQLWNSVIIDDTMAKEYVKASNVDHRLIIECLEKHDEKGASSAITAHVHRSYENILKKLNATTK